MHEQQKSTVYSYGTFFHEIFLLMYYICVFIIEYLNILLITLLLVADVHA